MLELIELYLKETCQICRTERIMYYKKSCKKCGIYLKNVQNFFKEGLRVKYEMEDKYFMEHYLI